MSAAIQGHLAKAAPLLVACALILVFLGISAPHLDGYEHLAIHSWWDQYQYLLSTQAVLDHRAPQPLLDGWHGPGFILSAALLAKAAGLSAEAALILLNQSGWLLAILFFTLIQFEVTGRGNARPSLPAIAIVAFGYGLAVLIPSDFKAAYWIPWSHSIAQAWVLGAVWCAIRFTRSGHPWKRHGWLLAAGLFEAILINTRLFEAAVSIFTISALVLGTHREKDSSSWTSASRAKATCRDALLLLAPPVLLTWLISASLDLRGPHLFYYELGKLDPSIRELLRLRPELLPYKLVQLFFHPDFLTFKDPAYAPQSIFSAYGFSDWHQPILLQIPVLLYVIPAFFALAFLGWRRQGAASLMNAQSVAGWTGLMLMAGYLSSVMSGSPHLLNGFVRDFFAPTWLLACSTSPALFLGRAGKSSRFLANPKAAFLASCLPLAWAGILGGGILPLLIPARIPALTVGSVEAEATCHGLDCRYHIDVRNMRGQLLRLPGERFVFNMFCPYRNHPPLIRKSADLRRKFSLLSDYCEHAYDSNCRDIGAYQAVTAAGYDGPLRLIDCPTSLAVHVYSGILGNGAVPPGDRTPPIYLKVVEE